jgi:hypothetical protein
VIEINKLSVAQYNVIKINKLSVAQYNVIKINKLSVAQYNVTKFFENIFVSFSLGFFLNHCRMKI